MLRNTMSSPPPDPASFARLFVGLWPNDAVRDAVHAHAECWLWTASSRRVPRSKLHMTLHFLGGVPRERVPELVRGLDVPFVPFALQLDRGEVWSNQVAVLQPRTTPNALTALHGRLQIALGQLQQPTAREALEPHVTLARKAKGARSPPLLEPITWRVDGYALIESLPSAGYRVLFEYP